MRWAVVTNGFALDAVKLRALRSAGLASITVILDGDRKTHGYFRNSKLSYDLAMSDISLNARSDIP